jgi:Tfp pilus assembly protein PilF
MTQKSEHITRLAGFLKENPNDIFSKFALALELLKINEVTKAQILFESVLKQDRDYLGVYYHLGKLYQKTGRFDDARKIFEDGINVAYRQNNEKTRLELNEALEILNIDTENGS